MAVVMSKKLSGLLATGLLISLSLQQTSFADTTIPTPTASETNAGSTGTSSSSSADAGVLAQIAQYTQGTLQQLNNLPSDLDAMLKLVASWLTPDTSDSTANFQASFSTYGTQALQSSVYNASLQNQLEASIFGTNLSAVSGKINDLDYLTVLGSPYSTLAQGVDSSYNYIQYASGAGVNHLFPDPLWSGYPADVATYTNYFYTVSAVQSYNAYLLSKVYLDNKNGNQLSQAQNSLLTQATSTSWFSQVASEELGIVLRQLLMFTSQSYVLLSQSIQVQKELLTAQAMTNTLLILSNQAGESLLVMNAKAKTH